MNIRGTIGAIGGLFLMLGFGSFAHAQSISNQATEMTFQQSVRIPGKVLPAGTYWFTVLDEGPNGGTNRVQVKSADGNKVIATLLTENADHAQFGQEVTTQGVSFPTGKVVIRIAEGRQNEPVTLLDWYYPGNTAGHKFVYSSERQKRIDEEKQETMSFTPNDKVTIGSNQAGLK